MRSRPSSTFRSRESGRVAAGGAWLRLGIGASLFAAPALAQVRSSDRGRVSQTVDGTVIEVDYGRPALRGRTPFGGIVHWGEMWTPGANSSTTIRVSGPVTIAGKALPAGAYSMWLVPTEIEWTLGLHRNSKLYHLERPKPTDLFLRLPVTPIEAPAVERLTFSFPNLRPTGATLRFHWGTKAIDLDIGVPSTRARRPQLRSSDVAAYLGTYQAWTFAETRDSAEMRFTLTLEDGRLRGVYGDGEGRFELVPTGRPREFWFESHDRDGPEDQERASPVRFTLDRRGRATGFTMKGIEQPLWMRATRQ